MVKKLGSIRAWSRDGTVTQLSTQARPRAGLYRDGKLWPKNSLVEKFEKNMEYFENYEIYQKYCSNQT